VLQGAVCVCELPVSTSQPQLNATDLSGAEKERLLAAARAMLARAYAPYSKFHVGAAVLTGSGATYTGCNVENASYGLTICAERAAICAAVAAEGEAVRIRAVAVLNGNNVSCSPCGACRQVIFEFGPDAAVIFQGRDGLEHSTARALLPAGFTL
jgi:cytidine deaminase